MDGFLINIFNWIDLLSCLRWVEHFFSRDFVSCDDTHDLLDWCHWWTVGSLCTLCLFLCYQYTASAASAATITKTNGFHANTYRVSHGADMMTSLMHMESHRIWMLHRTSHHIHRIHSKKTDEQYWVHAESKVLMSLNPLCAFHMCACRDYNRAASDELYIAASFQPFLGCPPAVSECFVMKYCSSSLIQNWSVTIPRIV